MTMNLENYNLRRHAERVRKQIAAWDHNNVEVLRELLIDFENTRSTLEFDRVYIAEVDGSDLPSEEFPVGFDTTGYWALDKQGYAVCGVSWESHELKVVKI
jgi:hypothetical protein